MVALQLPATGIADGKRLKPTTKIMIRRKNPTTIVARIAIDEYPQTVSVRDTDTSLVPLGPMRNASTLTRNKLCDISQCNTPEMIITGMPIRYGS
jgi:hypothetical protein